MKIGLLCCFYDCHEYLERVMRPWWEIRNSNCEIEIAVVHGQFKEYHELGYEDNDNQTVKLLDAWRESENFIDFLYVQNPYRDQKEQKYQTEAEIRDKGLQYLLSKNCDFVWLLDGDEIYNVSEIKNAIEFVQFEQFITWFRIEFKNLTFSENTYTEGFMPPRIFRTKIPKYRLNHVFWDNDIDYCLDTDPYISATMPYTAFAHTLIPKNKCHPLHYTWLNNNISKRKVEYQTKHFAKGAGCAFAWDEQKGLIWNQDYFNKIGSNPPILKTI